jgi:hypothetical protein
MTSATNRSATWARRASDSDPRGEVVEAREPQVQIAQDQRRPPIAHDLDAARQRTVPEVVCSKCRKPIDPGQVVAHGGPGGRGAPGTRVIAKLLRQRAAAVRRRG